MYSLVEVQCSLDESQVPAYSGGKPCDPQEGPNMGEVSEGKMFWEALSKRSVTESETLIVSS